MDALILPDALHGGPRRVSEYVNIADSGVPHQVKTAEWILRIALFGEFVGHGTFAFRAVPHFQELMAGALGITTEAAAVILPVVGVIDFTVAVPVHSAMGELPGVSTRGILGHAEGVGEDPEIVERRDAVSVHVRPAREV